MLLDERVKGGGGGPSSAVILVLPRHVCIKNTLGFDCNEVFLFKGVINSFKSISCESLDIILLLLPCDIRNMIRHPYDV